MISMGPRVRPSASVPVPAMPLSILPMQRPLGIMLALLGVLLMIGIAGIVAAAVGQSRLSPGVAGGPAAAPPGTCRRPDHPGGHSLDRLWRLQVVERRSGRLCRGHLPSAEPEPCAPGQHSRSEDRPLRQRRPAHLPGALQQRPAARSRPRDALVRHSAAGDGRRLPPAPGDGLCRAICG